MDCNKDYSINDLSTISLGIIQKRNHSVSTNNCENKNINLPIKGLIDNYSVFPSIELSFVLLNGELSNFEYISKYKTLNIIFCRNGRISLSKNDIVYLGLQELLTCTMNAQEKLLLSFPLGYFEGIVVHINIEKLNQYQLEILQDIGISGDLLFDKFSNNTITKISNSNEIQQIFSSIYDTPQKILMPYLKIKMQELLFNLCNLNYKQNNSYSNLTNEQMEIIKNIHELLISNLDKHFTIEQLSKKYLINTTTLKSIFKSVYGVSIAAHIKEHRLEKAAFLLKNTNDNISDIAKVVGYENQSKFTQSFKNKYQLLPTEYRKQTQKI